MTPASLPSALLRKAVRIFTGPPALEQLIRSEEYFAALDQDMPLSAFEFTVVDTELTGMNPRRDEIVAIGAVRIKNMAIQLEDAFFSLVHPRVMTKTSILIHHITPEKVLEAPRLYKVLPAFVDYVGNSFVVGHHVGLDMSFLNLACKKIFNSGMPNPCIDTMRLAQAYEAKLWESYYDRFDLNVSFNLNHLAKRYHLPEFEAHHALSDAIQAAYLYLFLLRKLEREGVRTLKDLYQAGSSWSWYF